MPAVIKVALPTPLYPIFDYLAPKGELSSFIGLRVKVPFGSRELVGFVVDSAPSSTLDSKLLKAPIEVIDAEPLFDETLFDLFKKTARYYQYPLGMVLHTGLPKAIREGKTLGVPVEAKAQMTKNMLELNSEQTKAFQSIDFTHFQCNLLYGVTGSGKTEIYLHAIKQVLENGHQALVILPEIALTPQTIQRFVARFGDQIGLYHSKLTPKKRLETWLGAKSGHLPIVVGTRSCAYIPFQSLQLIVLDEEHDSSFKQQEGFRYSARDVAIWRAHALNIPVILGSATPSLESLQNALSGRYQLLSLPNKIASNQALGIQLLDIRHKRLEGGLSPKLLSEIQKHLDQKGQVLLFMNRRGFAPVLMCFECGWLAACHRCSAKLNYHRDKNRLICHHCQSNHTKPKSCPTCKSEALHPLGEGTQRIEAVLQEKFKSASILRMDSDSTRKKGELEDKLQLIKDGNADIVIGTSMISKGHHYPNITLVGIINADGGLYSMDFRAIERMAQLVTQVSGRCGRANRPGQVVIQSHHPDNILLQTMIKSSYLDFAKNMLLEREATLLPPFAHLASINSQGKNEKSVQEFLNTIRSSLGQEPEIRTLGPMSKALAKKGGHFQYQLIVKSGNRQNLQRLLPKIIEKCANNPIKNVKWTLDVDPIEVY